jgi:peroxiredoxin Q/BCP
MKQLLFAMAVSSGLAVVTAFAQQAPVVLNVGDKAPDFSLPGTDGKTHTLAEYKGKTVILAWFPKAATTG